MKALRLFIIRFFVVAVVIAGVSVFYCANPVDEPPLKWRSKLELPVTNDTFYLGLEMDNLFGLIDSENVEMLRAGIDAQNKGKDYVDNPRIPILDTVKGDTTIFSVLREDTTSYTVSEDSMEAKYYHPLIGAIPISGAPAFLDTLPIPSGSFNQTIPVPLSRVYEVAFDSSSPPLSVIVTNISSADITSLNMTILGTTQNAGSLGSSESATLSFPTALQNVTTTLPITVQGSASAAASIEVSFDLNGTVAARLRVHHSLITFDTLFYNNYELTDTLDVDYIDISNGMFRYTVQNHTGMDLEFQSFHDHLWSQDYCEALNAIEKYEDIAVANPSHVDSAQQFWGYVTNGYSIIMSDSTDQIQKANISQCRLFPTWDTATKNSVSRVKYYVRKSLIQTDSIITLSKGDSLMFIIEAPLFKFEEMLGTVMEPYNRKGDTQTVAIPFPWNKECKDSLRNRFILEMVFGDIFLESRVPARAFIDTFNITYKMFTPTVSPLAICSSSTTFLNIKDSALFRNQVDITKIVNLFPDSACITADINIPRGTRIRAVNDLLDRTDPEYNKYMGRMIIKGLTDVRMNAVLHWQITDTASLDLGTGKFPVPEALRFFNKMERRLFSYNMNAYNNTNVYMDIFALVAPYSLIDSLDSMSVNETWVLIQDTVQARAQGYVSFLGTQGIKIPPRDSTEASNIVLNDWQIGQILGSDTCGWRWQARFLPKATDALHDTDYIKINSWMHMEGDNNFDSLLIWNNDD